MVHDIMIHRLSAQTVNISVTTTGPSTKLHLSVGSTNLREYIYHNRLSNITKPVAINSVSHKLCGSQPDAFLCITLCIVDVNNCTVCHYSYYH